MSQIVFEFIGGPHDGRVVAGQRGQGDDAERFYLFSNHGAVGQRFKVVSDYAVNSLARRSSRELRFRRHVYIVIDRCERDDDISVRAHYLRQETVR